MNRKRKLVYNSLSSIFKQVIGLLCALILPRMMLVSYGSSLNGLASSISQFLSLISIFDAGMGVVIEASLYKPLSLNDKQGISKVMASGKKFYNKIVVILFFYVLIISLVYPKFVINNFSFLFVFSLVWAISLNLFGQYYFGVLNGVLISADQKSFVFNWVYTIATVLNTIVSIFLIKIGASIHVVKLFSSIVFLIRPCLLALYVRRNYDIDWKANYSVEPIKQKWNGFAQHIATIVVSNTDVVVLTLFSSLKDVSIYTVYLLVVNGIKELINSCMNGVKSLFGDMLAKKEYTKLLDTFKAVEACLHILVVFTYAASSILIVSFIGVYTKGVTDADYVNISFAITFCIAYAVYCLRLPYNTIIMSAGRFKETQNSAIIEAIINIIVSIILVVNFGLIGVAIGTLIAMMYRLIYLVVYTHKHILMDNFSFTLKLFFIDILFFIISLFILRNFIYIRCINYLEWVVLSTKVVLIEGIIGIFFLVCFFRKEIKYLVSMKDRNR